MRSDQKWFTGHASNYIYVSIRRPQAFGLPRLRILASIITLIRTHNPVAFVAEERLFQSKISQGFHNINKNVFFNISKIRALNPKMCVKKLTANQVHRV